tara:strand:- start:201 stop:494 length:294 start_codon:yes stop_codon:yes gene_type:complete
MINTWKNSYITKSKTVDFFKPDGRKFNWIKQKRFFAFDSGNWYKITQSIRVTLFSFENAKHEKNPFCESCQLVTNKRSLANLNRFHKKGIENFLKTV